MADWEKELAERKKVAAAAFSDLVETIARLRHPTEGCPWDLKQTHETLRPYMIEEAYEASAALGSRDPKEMADELGDVLLQVVLNAQLGNDAGQFSIMDVIQGLDAKMRRRHPHVFAMDQSNAVKTAEDVRRNWDEIKKEERKNAPPASMFAEEEGIFPSLLQAHKIGGKAKKVDFDWNNADEVFVQLRSEWQELEQEWKKTPTLTKHLQAEIGDVFFSLAQFCRHLDINPEVVAQDGNDKFLRRFRGMEALMRQRGLSWQDLSDDAKENLWREIKKSELRGDIKV